MDMVDEVARKLYEASCALDPVEPKAPEWGRDGYKTEVVYWHGLARAAIAAMREPTAEMQRAAFNQKVSFRSTSGMSDLGQVSVEYASEPDKGAATLWAAMIDAALGGTDAA